MVRIAFISDTHNLVRQVKIHAVGKIDLIVHAGDFSDGGSPDEIVKFGVWAREQRVPVIAIAGNHDRGLAGTAQSVAQNEWLRGVTYLEDSGCEALGLRFFGVPWTPRFGEGWAFMYDRDDRERFWRHLRPCDVLITHGPPLGILDTNEDGEHCGCWALKEAAERLRPRICVFGHIHASYGMKMSDHGTLYINASSAPVGRAKRMNLPIVVEL